jgi:hypothetical protein
MNSSVSGWGCHGIHGASGSRDCITKGAQDPDSCGGGPECALGTGHCGVSVHTGATAIHLPVVQSAGALVVWRA